MALSRELSNHETDLSAYIRDELFESFKDNRAPLEDKWKRNRTIWQGDVTQSWKSHQDTADDTSTSDWRSNTKVDIANQKATMACSIINNMAFKKGRLPFRFDNLDPLTADSVEKHENDDKLTAIQNYIDDITFRAEVPSECRKGILQAAIYGVSYYKTNFDVLTSNRFEPDPETGEFIEVQYEDEYLGLERVSVWDIFRDYEYDDLQTSRGIIHRQFLSSYDLRSFIGKSFYIDEAIQSAIEEQISGDYESTYEEDTRPDKYNDLTSKDKSIEYLECWVRVPQILVKNYLKDNTSERHGHISFNLEELNDGNEMEVLVGIVGNQIVRFAEVEQGIRPFFRQPWEDDPDELDSIGVMDKLERYQNTITGAFREFENNKKLSGNVMTAIKRKMVKNMPERAEPGILLEISEDCEDVRQAIQPIVIPDVGDSLLSVINLTMDMADMTSNIPREVTGQASGNVSSVSEYNQMIARSSKYLLSVISNFDQYVLEPYLERFYEYLMVDEDMRPYHGNFKVKAIGFESFEARSVKLNQVMQVLTMSAQSPDIAGKVNMDWLLTEIAKGNDIDPDRVLKSEEQIQMEMQQAQEAQNNDPMYQLEIEEKKADIDKIYADIELDKIKAQIELEKLQLEKAKLVMMPESNVSGGVEALATGGIVDPDKTTLVGEAGPELITSPDGDQYITDGPEIIPEGDGGHLVQPLNENSDTYEGSDYVDSPMDMHNQNLDTALKGSPRGIRAKSNAHAKELMRKYGIWIEDQYSKGLIERPKKSEKLIDLFDLQERE